MRRPAVLWMLIFWLLFLALGGIYGGIVMLLDPSGGSLQMTEVLPQLPVPNYFLPGIFLLLVMGLLPLLLAYGLFARPHWAWLQSFTRQTKYHWAWIGTVFLGVILAVWLIVEGVLIGFQWAIQYITAINGLLIFLLVFSPSVKKHFKKE